jgi:phosphopantothenoylcysteine decarboxylase/phosphopantothenate--cysteine ligase
LLLVAPATADLIAKMACGIADDAITTTYLAYAGDVMLAPAMNTQMLQHPATQQNLSTLQQRGVELISAEAGVLACGDVGAGRLAEPEHILQLVIQHFDGSGTKAEASTPTNTTDTSLAGKTVVITSGPTHEYIDPVRFISNPSSGRMGAALAEEACRRGATVHLVTGPVDTAQKPARAKIHDVTTAEEMLRAVSDLQPQADILIFAAAVGDFRAAHPVTSKIKRTGNSISLPLIENPDIAQTIGRAKRPGQMTVGFAAETNDLQANAQAKLERKNLDAIIANNVADERIGFQSTENEVTIFFRNGHQVHVPRQDKRAVARAIIDALLKSSID